MNTVFALKVILSFFVGGVYAIGATVIADKLGSKIGGLISALPSTVLFGLLFIAWTQSVQVSVSAMTIVPATIGLACVYLVTYVTLVKKNVWLAVLVAGLIWAVFAYGLLALHVTNLFLSILIFCVFFCIAYVFINHIYTIPAKQGNKITYTTKILLLRGIISGGVVAFSVLMAKIGGPVLGVMFSTFPAMFTSTVLITYFSHGHEFSSAMGKSSLFGWISSLIFTIVAYYSLLPLGVFFGTLLALLACYGSAYAVYQLTVKKHG